MRLRDLFNREERHRRKAEKDRRRGRHERLGKKDARHVFEIGEMVHQLKTGEYPIVERAFDEPPTVAVERSDYALQQFHADPLGAAILPAELDEAHDFLGTIRDETLAGRLKEPVAADLERTGAWYAWEIRQMVERGQR